MSQLPSAVCFSGKSLSIIDRDGTPYLSARELARALGYKDTVSLTTAHRCGTVFGKEPKNSGSSGNRTRNPCGFFTPARFYVGRAAAIQHPQGESCPPSTSGFLASRHPQVRRLRTSPLWSSHEVGDVL
ncbi:phage antirepressor protein [Xylella fastidiosa]|uniref:phage antirepressor protein n=2 Tax=Xylella fastidiosa TaxID=2371 RepID=UPI0009D66646|nr:phage antirepressor protein [Xylella fastidiosa]QIS26413.1 phage antirepressor protein [Xylella fastidiosa]RWA34476.1 phage antirepressor protein [Xylella fastidiosa subsp. fastidiosa]